jgi:integrase
MSVYRDKSRGAIIWRYRTVVILPSGQKVRISGTPAINTKAAAVKAETDHIKRVLDPSAPEPVLPTLSEWFDERFWTEWVIGEGNRPGTQGEKRSAFDQHIRPVLGDTPLDRIDTAAIQRFKAALAGKKGRFRDPEGNRLPLSAKSRSNILAVLSKALRYAEESGVLTQAPRVKLGKFERPDIECWDLEEYARMVEAARKEGHGWHAGVLLAGEAGLRIGEVIALRWEDLDLVAGTITVARQIRQGAEGPTKGGRARKVPMTPHLLASLLAMPHMRRGPVVVAADGVAITEGRLKGHGIYRVCRLAGLPERSWHALRHSYATHAALLGVNPWRLQAWLGHTSIGQTMRYVSHAEQHRRPIPGDMLDAAREVTDPDERILTMLGARSTASYERRDNVVPTEQGSSSSRADSKSYSVRATGIEPVAPAV